MANRIFYVCPRPGRARTCPCETPTNLYVQKKRDLVPGGTEDNRAACALISAASSFLLVVLLILLLKAVLHYVLHYILYYATNWHGRFFRLFLTLLRPNNGERTCPGHDRGSAGTRQGDPTSSCPSVHPSLAFPPAAGRQYNAGEKRPGNDESDAEDNDRNSKRPRKNLSKKSKARRVRCPFKDHDPDNPNFETCSTFDEWRLLREHLLDRKHRKRERCAICGEIFYEEVKWDEHTGLEQECHPSSQPLESPFWVNKYQDAEIRKLSSKGRKNQEPIEEMYRRVCKILFGDEIAPARSASGHPTWDASQPSDSFDKDDRPQEPLNVLTRRIGDLLGMHDVPHDTMLQIIDCVGHYLEYSRGQSQVFQSYEPEPELGEAVVDEHLWTNEASIADRMPAAGPSQGPIPEISASKGHGEGRSEGQLDQFSIFLQEGSSDPLPALNDNTSFEMPSQFPSTEFAADSGTSQLSDTAFLESFWDQSFGDTNYLNSMEMPDSLDNFDFSVDGFCPDVGPMQDSGGGSLEHRSEDEDRDAPVHLN